jgi:hypothetical protein
MPRRERGIFFRRASKPPSPPVGMPIAFNNQFVPHRFFGLPGARFDATIQGVVFEVVFLQGYEKNHILCRQIS